MSSLKWYHTQRWRRRAALQLKLNPLCAICLQFLIDAQGFGKCLAVNMSLSIQDMADQI
jgi:hypothetical protein